MRWMPVFTLLVVALSGCTRPDASEPSEAAKPDGPVAAASLPEWKVGDAWTYVMADGSRATRHVAREGVPCGRELCWEIVRVAGDEIDVAYVNASTLGIAPFPVEPGDEWENGDVRCRALEAQVLGEHGTIPLRCEGGQGTSVAFYAPQARNLVQLDLVDASGSSATALRLVQAGESAAPPLGGLLPVPIFQAGRVWSYQYEGAGETGALRREVVALGVPCGETLCYEIRSTYEVDGSEDETVEWLDATTLSRVVDGELVGDVRFPLRAGMEWSFVEPTDGIERTCAADETFVVVCTDGLGAVTASTWSAQGLTHLREDGEARWTLVA